MPNAFAVGQLVEHVFGAKGPYRIVGSMQHRSDGERQYLVTDAVGRVTQVVHESNLREAGAEGPHRMCDRPGNLSVPSQSRHE